jgi:hypothetical protein
LSWRSWQQFFNYIMTRKSKFSMRWWWGPLCTRPTCLMLKNCCHDLQDNRYSLFTLIIPTRFEKYMIHLLKMDWKYMIHLPKMDWKYMIHLLKKDNIFLYLYCIWQQRAQQVQKNFNALLIKYIATCTLFKIIYKNNGCLEGRDSNFSTISWREKVNFQWDDDEVRFVLDQHA